MSERKRKESIELVKRRPGKSELSVRILVLAMT